VKVEDLDLKAVARVARFVDVEEIRLAEISGNSSPQLPKAQLVPHVEHECVPSRYAGKELEVSCSYRFTARSGDAEIGKLQFKYVIVYSIETDEKFAEEDVRQFAFANGTYHSWPFVRQLLFDLTSKMGYPAFTLPTFRFNPKPPDKKEPAQAEAASAAAPEATSPKTKKK
jgi:preprotein translocase subunit SecB